jgi:hypothetical protein
VGIWTSVFLRWLVRIFALFRLKKKKFYSLEKENFDSLEKENFDSLNRKISIARSPNLQKIPSSNNSPQKFPTRVSRNSVY